MTIRYALIIGLGFFLMAACSLAIESGDQKVLDTTKGQITKDESAELMELDYYYVMDLLEVAIKPTDDYYKGL